MRKREHESAALGLAITHHSDGLGDQFAATRAFSERLVEDLSDADATVQSMDDASPAKWHLAHTSWFFEEFVLSRDRGYEAFDPAFRFLFNSYYEAVGPRHPRPRRGLLTRPSLAEVLSYRRHVTAAVLETLARGADKRGSTSEELIELGIHHEQQHQELLQTDILHLFAQSPIKPAYINAIDDTVAAARARRSIAPSWSDFEGGRLFVGHRDSGFAFDSETPRHEVIVRPYLLQDTLVTNGQWQAFVADGGYRRPELWLSDGWAWVQREGCTGPLYWEGSEGPVGQQMTLRGLSALAADEPVRHISFFEADAYARWADARLPTEFEWEAAASEGQTELQDLFGEVWQWTASPFIAYPGFRTRAGAVGEYNGKFMSGQYVLRGSSSVTPRGHSRATYRNFFYPTQRWQFTGLRLARDQQ